MTTIYDPHHPLYLDEADTRSQHCSRMSTCTTIKMQGR
jgi:hypothetical protein